METKKDDFQLRNEDSKHDYMLLSKEEVYETIDTAYKNGYYWVIERANTVQRLYAQPYVKPTYYTQFNDLTYVYSELFNDETIKLNNCYKLEEITKHWTAKYGGESAISHAEGKIWKEDSEHMFYSVSQNYGGNHNEYRTTLQIELKKKSL